MQAAEPAFASAELERLFAPFSRFAHVALAVSGGSDSMALMVLASRWQAENRKSTKITVITIDHGLREASANEAAFVCSQAAGLGLVARVIEWSGDKPGSGVQAAARQFRLDAMTRWCLNNNAGAFATAHTADDQAETFIMRLARGSGLDGLSAIASDLSGKVTVMRPFLGIRRDRLRVALTEAGVDWIDDPSNEDEQFERVRVRHAQPVLDELGLAVDVVSKSTRRLARARQALDFHADQAFREIVAVHVTGYCTVNREGFDQLPEETRIRVLGQCFRLNGAHGWLKLSAIEDLLDWTEGDAGTARTLSGCRIARRRESLLIGREPGRISQDRVPLPEARPIQWDNRFMLSLSAPQDNLEILPVRAIGLDTNDKELVRDPALPAFVWEGLPVIVAEHGIAAVPHARYSAPWFKSHVNIEPVQSVATRQSIV